MATIQENENFNTSRWRVNHPRVELNLLKKHFHLKKESEPSPIYWSTLKV
jgi:hypothetical protein